MENEVSSKNTIKHLEIIDSKKWLTLIGVILFAICVCIWLFVIKMELTLSYKGIISTSGEDYIVNGFDKGIVTDVLVHWGDYVEAGDVVARIYPTNDNKNEGYLDVGYDTIKDKSKDVRAMEQGFVDVVYVNPWEKVDTMAPLMEIARENKKSLDTVYILVKDKDLKYLKKGMDAKIYIEGLRDTSVNYIAASIVNIDDYNSIVDEVIYKYGEKNSNFIDNFLSQGNDYYVTLRLKSELNGDKDANSLKIEDATRFKYLLNKSCNVEFLVGEFHPISFLIK